MERPIKPIQPKARDIKQPCFSRFERRLIVYVVTTTLIGFIYLLLLKIGLVEF